MITESRITSLDQLLEILPSCTSADYKAIAKDMEIAADEVAKYASWRSDRYTRNCIVRKEAYELILLCWEPGQETAVHCHGGEECWVYNMQGTILETNFEMLHDQPVETDASILGPGQVSYMNDDLGYHKLANNGDGRCMTLHLYMNPIDHCTSWEAATGAFMPVSPSYDTIGGQPCD